MTVQEILDLTKLRLQNLIVVKDDKALLSFINLGVSTLYRKFNLSVKSETVMTTGDLALYELRNQDVLLLLGVYDRSGRELQQTDTLGSETYDYKIVNYRSFLLRKPRMGMLYAVYLAAPVPLKDVNDVIDLPDAMLDALLIYITYLAHTGINRDNVNESSFWYQKFLAACNELEMEGYKIPLNVEMYPVQSRGFV